MPVSITNRRTLKSKLFATAGMLALATTIYSGFQFGVPAVNSAISESVEKKQEKSRIVQLVNSGSYDKALSELKASKLYSTSSPINKIKLENEINQQINTHYQLVKQENEKIAQQKEEEEIQKKAHTLYKITGTIDYIDEDSFYVEDGTFEFENWEVNGDNGYKYKIVFPRPSNYKVGDKIDVKIYSLESISYNTLVNVASGENPFEKSTHTSYRTQTGYLEVDGIIKR